MIAAFDVSMLVSVVKGPSDAVTVVLNSIFVDVSTADDEIPLSDVTTVIFAASVVVTVVATEDSAVVGLIGSEILLLVNAWSDDVFVLSEYVSVTDDDIASGDI